MIAFDEHFWVGLSVITFTILVAKPIGNLLNGFMNGKIESIKADLERANKLKQDAEKLLTEYLDKQQNIEQQIEHIMIETEQELKSMKELYEIQISDIMKIKSEQAICKINQYEITLLAEVRSQAVEIAFLAVRSIIRERLTDEDSEKIINSVLSNIEQRLH